MKRPAAVSPVVMGTAICNVLGLSNRAVMHASGNTFEFCPLVGNQIPYITLKVAITDGLLSEIDAEIKRLMEKP